MTNSEIIREVSPATVAKAEKIVSLLEEAQLLANELVDNDTLQTLKIDGFNVDYLVMQAKYKVKDYQQDIIDAMAHSF